MKKTYLLATAVSLIMFSCGTETNTNNNNQEKVEPQESGIKVVSASIAKEFPDAELMLGGEGEAHWEPVGKLKDGKIVGEEFNYIVKNYELAVPTEGEAERNCAVSEKGQHIHFIVNNEPYLAKYESSFTADLNEGTNIILSFLSRSYHESIKNGKAFNVFKYTMGEGNEQYDEVNLEQDHLLFYSRPKGTYKKSEGSEILLDFYLLNTELSETGYKVKAIIDDKEEVILTKWEPYFIEGLDVGEHIVQLELLDENNNLVDCAFSNSGKRTFQITED